MHRSTPSTKFVSYTLHPSLPMLPCYDWSSMYDKPASWTTGQIHTGLWEVLFGTSLKTIVFVNFSNKSTCRKYQKNTEKALIFSNNTTSLISFQIYFRKGQPTTLPHVQARGSNRRRLKRLDRRIWSELKSRYVSDFPWVMRICLFGLVNCRSIRWSESTKTKKRLPLFAWPLITTTRHGLYKLKKMWMTMVKLTQENPNHDCMALSAIGYLARHTAHLVALA